MKKQTFENVKTILTTHRTYGNETDYSLSLADYSSEGFEYYRINVYSNSERGSFHDGYASFFCQVAEIAGCSCSFRSENNVCICAFY